MTRGRRPPETTLLRSYSRQVLSRLLLGPPATALMSSAEASLSLSFPFDRNSLPPLSFPRLRSLKRYSLSLSLSPSLALTSATRHTPSALSESASAASLAGWQLPHSPLLHRRRCGKWHSTRTSSTKGDEVRRRTTQRTTAAA